MSDFYVTFGVLTGVHEGSTTVIDEVVLDAESEEIAEAHAHQLVSRVLKFCELSISTEEVTVTITPLNEYLARLRHAGESLRSDAAE